MNQILLGNITWTAFFVIAFFVFFIYLLFYLVSLMMTRFSLRRNWQNRIRVFIQQMLIIYELLAILFLIVLFILVNPIIHGFIFLFVLLGSLSYFKSYISGRWIHFDKVIREGMELNIEDKQGVVTKMGRLKMRMQTQLGLHDVSYYSLLSNGYTILSGENIGSFCHLELSPTEPIVPLKNHSIYLLDLLTTTPYIDWRHKPELAEQKRNGATSVNVNILLKEEQYLQDLISLIQEWGYQCSIK